MEPREVIADTIISASRFAQPQIPMNQSTANALADLIIAQLAGAGFQIVKADHPV